MSIKQESTEKLISKQGFFSNIFSLFLKQLIGSIICLALALGMKYSNNQLLNNYAKSLGLAIKFNPGWEDTVKEAFSNLSTPKTEENFR